MPPVDRWNFREALERFCSLISLSIASSPTAAASPASGLKPRSCYPCSTGACAGRCRSRSSITGPMKGPSLPARLKLPFHNADHAIQQVLALLAAA